MDKAASRRTIRSIAVMAARVVATALVALLWLAAPLAAGQTEAAGHSPWYAQGSQAAVATEHGLASDAALAILRDGGNAVDAAVAASLAIAVVNPSSAGLGGGGFMLVFIASEGRVYALDYRETAPRRATPDMYTPGGAYHEGLSLYGGTAVAVPGEVAGIEAALERFGTMPFEKVAGPAIALARNGFKVERHLASAIAGGREKIAASESMAAMFLHEDGSPYAAGELIRRPGLASTLEMMAKSGTRVFYEGVIAMDIAKAVSRHSGLVDAKDLGAYRVKWREPLLTDYRGRRVAGMGPPSSGGGTMATALRVLEPYRLSDMGAGSATYLHLLAEVLKAVFADRAAHYGDPDFIEFPLERLLSADHASEIRSRLSALRPVPSADYRGTATGQDAGTSHISVIDGQGNAVALTSSINTSFGSMVAVPRRGIVLNNTMDDFSARPGLPNVYGLVGSEANSIAAGKRPLSSMSPTIVLEDGAVRLVLGASGGPLIISAGLQTLISVLDFSQTIAEAVPAPRIHHQWMPEVLGVEKGLAAAVQRSLERRGHQLMPLTRGASVQAVERLGSALHAVSDPRKGGRPAAY